MHFMPCTTAKIHPTYGCSGTGSAKMVDFFFMYVEPSAFGLDDATAVDTAQKRLPEASINHTDFAPLRRRPIALSMESKTADHQLLEAEAQVGVWLAAQWRMLESLSQDETAEMPPFLPAVTIKGHDWHFISTTRNGGCTTLWAKQTFDSSETVLSIYQVVCVLRYLAQWATQHFWPSFRKCIL